MRPRSARVGSLILCALLLALVRAVPAFGGKDTVFGPAAFKGTGQAVTAHRTFTVPEGDGAYLLRVAQRGIPAVLIALNDRPIVTGQLPKLLEQPVMLPSGANALTVEFTAPVGSSLEIEIVKRAPPADAVPPVITATAEPPPGPNGWNATPVTVTFACSDAGSGIALCPASATVSSDGANQTVSGTAVDQAGNTATASVTLSVDRTPPVIALTDPPSPVGTTVTLTGVVTDAVSGVDTLVCNGSPAAVAGDTFSCTVTLAGGANTIQTVATDRAGNSGSGPPLTINQGAAPVESLGASPPGVAHQVPTLVTFTARLAASTAGEVEGVELEQRDEDGLIVATYGQMVDDGAQGDEQAGDAIYTLRTSLLESGPRVLRFHASIAFAGSGVCTLSSPVRLPVAISESVGDVKTELAGALSDGRLDSAYGRLGRQFNDERILDQLGAADVSALATALRSCAPTDTSPQHAICAGVAALATGPTQLHFLFAIDAVGQWRLISW